MVDYLRMAEGTVGEVGEENGEEDGSQADNVAYDTWCLLISYSCGIQHKDEKRNKDEEGDERIYPSCSAKSGAKPDEE